MRTSSYQKSAFGLICCILLLAVIMVMGGCGNSETSTAPPVTSATTPQAHVAASGPAISDKLSFDQLTLESPAKPQKDSNGLTFLHFKYADSDGKIYECVLPQAMSQGQYTLAEWSSTFTAYRLPKVIAVKKLNKKLDIGDYPFISPKPQAVTPSPDATQSTDSSQPVQVPQGQMPNQPPSPGVRGPGSPP